MPGFFFFGGVFTFHTEKKKTSRYFSETKKTLGEMMCKFEDFLTFFHGVEIPLKYKSTLELIDTS